MTEKMILAISIAIALCQPVSAQADSALSRITDFTPWVNQQEKQFQKTTLQSSAPSALLPLENAS